jgi:cyclopropane-fatty-acyl-phospholipid synthase
MTPKARVQELLSRAGLEIDGANPWDIQVHDDRLYGRVLVGGPLALGESYMDGWWDAERLDVTIDRILRARLDAQVGLNLETAFYLLRARLFNLQNRSRATEVVNEHYELGNDLYLAFLDAYNQYTCAYFKDTDNLDVAQERKLDLICRKIDVRRGDTVLDIGCGWGGFARFAAERYGAVVTGITLSDEQLAYARDYCKGLPVSLEKKDYRDLDGVFDKVVTVGMIEHVGYRNYRTFMEVVHRVLKDEGLFLLHTVGANWSSKTQDPWFDKYIFPNSLNPSIAQLGAAIERLFVMEDWHSFGAHYDKTLLAWFGKFDEAWPRLKDKYGERFHRMWRYYLLAMAGSFRSRANSQLWQIVFSKGGVPGGYQSVR